MAQKILDNFTYTGRSPLDAKQTYTDLTALKAASDRYTRVGLYNGLIAWVESEQKCYVFNNHVDKDVDLGYWRVATNMVPSIPNEDIIDVVK